MNILPVALATASSFALGGLWYSPFLFGPIWQKEEGLTEKQIKARGMIPYIYAFFYSLFSVLGFDYIVTNSTSLELTLTVALVISLLFVATSLGVNYQFADRSNKVFLIDAGYHVTRFVIYALIFWYVR